jgi:nucleotide-binding universal stress UspA family protein
MLLATDGSPQAEVAARLVGSLRLPAGAVVEILRADEPFAVDAELPPGAYDALRAAIHEEIEKDVAFAKAAVSAPGREIRVATPFARAATAIVDEAKRLAADLVVVGSRGRGQLATMVLGSVAAEVIDHAPCPVLVARSAKLGRLVLAHDGSSEAMAARDVVASWPLFRGLEARVVSVAPIPAAIGVGPIRHEDASQAYAEAVDALRVMYQSVASGDAQYLSDRGLRARAEVRCGDPAQELVDAAVEDEANLIVVGSHGRTGLERLLIGSVARKVVTHAPCSVLVVRQVAKL